jgi:hypothetical protein
MHFLLVRNEEEVFGQLATLLAALLDALSSDSERVVLQVRLHWCCSIGNQPINVTPVAMRLKQLMPAIH